MILLLRRDVIINIPQKIYTRIFIFSSLEQKSRNLFKKNKDKSSKTTYIINKDEDSDDSITLGDIIINDKEKSKGIIKFIDSDIKKARNKKVKASK